MTRPPLPPFTAETAAQKARLAEDAWNSRDPERVSLAYTEDSQWRNRADCMERAGQLIDAATVTVRRRRPTRPSRGSVERRLSSKRRIAEKKQGRRASDW